MISPEMVGVFITGAGVVGHIFVANYRIERNEKDSEKRDEKHEAEIADIWKWKNSHEKDVVDTREKYQIQLSELKGSLLVTNEQFKQIMAALTEIKDQQKEISGRLTDLENHKNRGN